MESPPSPVEASNGVGSIDSSDVGAQDKGTPVHETEPEAESDSHNSDNDYQSDVDLEKVQGESFSITEPNSGNEDLNLNSPVSPHSTTDVGQSLDGECSRPTSVDPDEEPSITSDSRSEFLDTEQSTQDSVTHPDTDSIGASHIAYQNIGRNEVSASDQLPEDLGITKDSSTTEVDINDTKENELVTETNANIVSNSNVENIESDEEYSEIDEKEEEGEDKEISPLRGNASLINPEAVPSENTDSGTNIISSKQNDPPELPSQPSKPEDDWDSLDLNEELPKSETTTSQQKQSLVETEDIDSPESDLGEEGFDFPASPVSSEEGEFEKDAAIESADKNIDRRKDMYNDISEEEDNFSSEEDNSTAISNSEPSRRRGPSTPSPVRSKSPVTPRSHRVGKSQGSVAEEHLEELDYDEEVIEEGLRSHDEADDEDGKSRDRKGSAKKEKEDDVASEKDDGELDDDEDCEEGEIREPGKKPFVKPTCRFFMNGKCTWGDNCRFLHPGVNDKGNYRLIERPGFEDESSGYDRRTGVWSTRGSEQPFEGDLPPPPMAPQIETAWERGLRTAKEMMKKASKRKELEPDFEEKKFNMSVEEIEEERDFDKENDMIERYPKDPYYDQYDEYTYDKGMDPQFGWHGGQYENFEVRHARNDDYIPPPHRNYPMRDNHRQAFRDHDKYSPPPPRRRYSSSPERFERRRDNRRERMWQHDRYQEPPPSQAPPMAPPMQQQRPTRADTWHDPWRRSKSPKRKARTSRSHSRGRRRTRRSHSYSSSYSSSSFSGSSRSRSRSSYSSYSSHSSASRSSSRGSRSRSPNKRPAGIPTRPQPQISRPGEPNQEMGRRKPPFQGNRERPTRPPDIPQRPNRPADIPQRPRPMDIPQRPGPMKMPPKGQEMQRQTSQTGRDRGPPRAVPQKRPRGPSGGGSSRSRSRSSSSRSSSVSSMSSVSSASSSTSSGSADSEHLYRGVGEGNKPPQKRTTEGHKKKKIAMPGKKMESPTKPRVQPGQGPKDAPVRDPREKAGHISRRERPSREERSESRGGGNRMDMGRQPMSGGQPKAKDPLKTSGHKQNIKLTLLPKQQASERPPSGRKRPPDEMMAGPPPPKRTQHELPPPPKNMEKMMKKPEKPPPKAQQAMPGKVKPTTSPTKGGGGKAPVSPVKAPGGKAAGAAAAKKSTSSRREELLKQLKAVEDAIARKRSKMS